MSEETIKVELPEIPGFERYKVGDIVRKDCEIYQLYASGELVKTSLPHMRITARYPLGHYYRRIEPENPPLSFENWQGALSIKARRKCDGRLVRIDALPNGVEVHDHIDNNPCPMTYDGADKGYETLDGGKIGRNTHEHG